MRASSGRLFSFGVQEEPPSLPALACDPRSLGLGKVCRKSPRASTRSERAVRSSPGFLYDPRASFSFRRRGCLPSPSCASLDRWVSAKLQEEPLSLRTEREGGQEFSWLLVRPSRILFVRKEGLFAEPFVCEPRPLGLGKVTGRAPEPPHLARGRSEVPLAFCTTLAHPFHSEGGVVCRALRVRA